MKCPDCGADMKPLAYSEYCPNDCDRKVEEEIDPEKTPKFIFFDSGMPRNPSSTSAVSSSLADDEELDKWWDGMGWDTD